MPLAQEFVCLTPSNDRALSADALADYLKQRGAKARVCDGIPDGIRLALTAAGTDGVVIAFGSLYLAGAVRTAFAPAHRQWLRKAKIRGGTTLQMSGRKDRRRSCKESLTRVNFKMPKRSCSIALRAVKCAWME